MSDSDDSDYVPSLTTPLSNSSIEVDFIDDEVEEIEEIEDVNHKLNLYLLKTTNPNLYNKFVEIEQYLKNEIPKIDVLLNTPMHLRDKAYILELLEILTTTEKNTYEWIDLKYQIKTEIDNAISKYNSYNALNTDEKIAYEREIKFLSEHAPQTDECKIALLNIPIEHKHLLYQRHKSLETMNTSYDEYGKIVEWVSTVLKIPFGKYIPVSGENTIIKLKNYLDREFYGLETVKEQILLYVSNRLYNPDDACFPIGLIGPPGTGKSSIALCISKILNIPFHQLSGGNLSDNNNIHGHSYTYIGAESGDIVKAVIKMGCMNGIIYIDEFEKIDMDKSLNSILQLLDPVQNNNFKDRYIGDIPIDLSRMWFIMSMNTEPEVAALKDRIFFVRIPKYTSNQIFQILKNFSFPKLISTNDVKMTFTDDAFKYIVNQSGTVRESIHLLKDIISKVSFIVRHPTVNTSFTVKINEIIRVDVDMIIKLKTPVKNDYSDFYI